MNYKTILFDCFFGFVIGVIYSLLFPLLGPRYLHFFPVASTLESLFFGLIGSGLFVFTGLLTKRFKQQLLWCLPALLIAFHALIWLLNYSQFATTASSIRVPASLAISLFLFGVVLLRAEIPLSMRSKINSICYLLSLSVLLLAVNYVMLSYLPQSLVDSWVLKDHPGETTSYGSSSLIAYPLSAPLEQTIDTYEGILPEIPEGRKIVTVVFDAFREDYFGRTLSGIPLTPNMSEFADEHRYFPNYYVQGNWTKPSVASFFTGKYIHQHATFRGGGRQVLEQPGQTKVTQQSGHVLPDEYATLAERLKGTGFKTAAYVSVPHISQNYNYDQGFDYYRYTSLKSVPENYHALRSLLFWMLRNQPEDAFLYLHLLGPHFGYDEGLNHNDSFWQRTEYKSSKNMLEKWSLDKTPPELMEKSLDQTTIDQHATERKILEYSYASDVNYYDKRIFPTIINSLKNLNTFKESLFLLTSDHGELLWDREGYYGHSNYLHEELLNVPLIVKLPDEKDGVLPNQNNDSLVVESLDLTATLLDHANARRDDLPGTSLLRFSNRRPKSREALGTAFAEETSGDRLQRATIIEPPWQYQHHYEKNTGTLHRLDSKPEDKRFSGKTTLRKKLQFQLKNFNPDGKFINPLPKLKNYTEGEREKLKGLGYLE